MRSRFFATGIILLGAAASLHAQQPDSAKTDSSAIQLQEIEVVGSIAPTAGATIGSGVPARISVVTGEEIDKWEPRLLADALVTQPGISLYDDLGSPFKLNLSTRGFNVGPVVGLPPGVSVFLDGVRQNEPDAQEVNFDLLPMEHVRRLELLSGSGSLLGANSLGGAINLITRRGTGPLEGELEASGGSYGNWSGEGSLAGLSKGGVDYYVAGGYENDDGWREATSAENYNGFVNLGKRNAVRGITLQGFGAHSRAETAGSLPESLFDTDPSANFTIGDFEDLDLLQLATSGYAPLGSGRLNFGAYGRRSTAERFNVNQAPDDNVRSLTTNGTVGLNLDWRRAWPVGNDAISLRIGSDAAVNRVHVKLFEEDPINSSDKTLTTDVKSPSWDVAGYALADYRTGRATFSGGFRYDYIRIPFEDQLDPSADTSSSFNRLSPRGGVSLDLGQGFSTYGSLGQSFRAPAVLELACADPTAACPLPFALGDDPPLDPVVGTTYELGGGYLGTKASITASVYRTDVRDDISFIQSSTAVFEGYFANIGDTRREGVEIGTQYFPTSSLQLYANYAWTRATYRTAAAIFSVRSDAAFAGSQLAGPNTVQPGDRLPLVPDQQIKVGLSWQLNRTFDLGVDGRYTGHQWLRGDEGNETSELNDYATANVRAGITLGQWEVNAVLTNAFNSHSAIFGTFNENRNTGELERFLTPLNARSIKVILKREFGG
jgi:iron complex outermembrane receptor protein